MNKYLYLFTITPVQAFIEQSRKTQDLYAGSFLLSYLCRTAGEKLMELKPQAKIIFPLVEQINDHAVDEFYHKGSADFPSMSNKPDKNLSIPNRLLASIEADGTELNSIGLCIKNTVEAELMKLTEIILKEMKISPEPEGFAEQLRGYFTINWLFLPYSDADYNAHYAEIDRMMGAIKNIRVFQQHADNRESGRKCSVCGERNIKIYKLRENEWEQRVLDKKLFVPADSVQVCETTASMPGLKYLQPGEGLCAVCFSKRSMDKVFNNNLISDIYFNANFPSTAEIALMDTLDDLLKTESADELRSVIKKGAYEPQGIFDLKNKRKLKDTLEGYHPDILKNTEKIYKALKDNQIELTPYYALMLFDGDSMGEWLSGEKIKDGRLKEFHQKLAKCLAGFANKVREIINKPEGVTVYAGGEDFLGFFNLKYLLKCMQSLRCEFEEMVNDQLKDYYKDEDLNMTFSAGIVIAHYKTPLSEALGWARKMEHEAKEADINKNRFAIAVLKHSGEIEKTICKWRYDEKQTVDIIARTAKHIKLDQLSNTFIKTFSMEMFRLMIDSKYTEDSIIKAELKRLIRRSCQEGDFEAKKKFGDNVFQNLTAGGLLDTASLQNYLGLLNVIDFIARETKSEVPL